MFSAKLLLQPAEAPLEGSEKRSKACDTRNCSPAYITWIHSLSIYFLQELEKEVQGHPLCLSIRYHLLLTALMTSETVNMFI